MLRREEFGESIIARREVGVRLAVSSELFHAPKIGCRADEQLPVYGCGGGENIFLNVILRNLAEVPLDTVCPKIVSRQAI